MTQDEIIEMARQAGLIAPSAVLQEGRTHDRAIEAFAKLVALRYEKKIADLENIICQRYWNVLQEREACAKIADDLYLDFAHDIAMEIRARGQA